MKCVNNSFWEYKNIIKYKKHWRQNIWQYNRYQMACLRHQFYFIIPNHCTIITSVAGLQVTKSIQILIEQGMWKKNLQQSMVLSMIEQFCTKNVFNNLILNCKLMDIWNLILKLVWKPESQYPWACIITLRHDLFDMSFIFSWLNITNTAK